MCLDISVIPNCVYVHICRIFLSLTPDLVLVKEVGESNMLERNCKIGHSSKIR